MPSPADEIRPDLLEHVLAELIDRDPALAAKPGPRLPLHLRLAGGARPDGVQPMLQAQVVEPVSTGHPRHHLRLNRRAEPVTTLADGAADILRPWAGHLDLARVHDCWAWSGNRFAGAAYAAEEGAYAARGERHDGTQEHDEGPGALAGIGAIVKLVACLVATWLFRGRPRGGCGGWFGDDVCPVSMVDRGGVATRQ